MTNADKLRAILRELIEQGKISRYQTENKVVVQEIISRKALMPAGIISFILWIGGLRIWHPEDSLFRDLSFSAFFVPMFIVVYLFLKSRVENQ